MTVKWETAAQNSHRVETAAMAFILSSIRERGHVTHSSKEQMSNNTSSACAVCSRSNRSISSICLTEIRGFLFVLTAFRGKKKNKSACAKFKIKLNNSPKYVCAFCKSNASLWAGVFNYYFTLIF